MGVIQLTCRSVISSVTLTVGALVNPIEAEAMMRLYSEYLDQ